MTDVLTGRLPSDLGNKISDAIFDACQAGMDVDDACCVVVAVAGDYWGMAYGAKTVYRLAEVILANAGRPLPAPPAGKGAGNLERDGATD